jgi:hypothetical protein
MLLIRTSLAPGDRSFNKKIYVPLIAPEMLHFNVFPLSSLYIDIRANFCQGETPWRADAD